MSDAATGPCQRARYRRDLARVAGVRTGPARPPVGGVSSPQGAMIFYQAHGAEETYGPGCSEWIAAEGVVECATTASGSALLRRLRREGAECSLSAHSLRYLASA